ncbi:MAG: type II TA system antitoxin MqsA family protein [Candidatus Izemoplasmataceae bacterium]
MENKIYCPKCDKKVHKLITETEQTRKVKGIEYTLHVPSAKCIYCDALIVDVELEKNAQMLFFDQYATDHGLLTAQQIIDARKKYDLSQRDFSRLLGLGEITISRYETGSLPTKVNSDLIRELSSLNKVLNKYYYNKEHLSKKGVQTMESLKNLYQGNSDFNRDKFDELVWYFSFLAENSSKTLHQTFLNKLMFFTDFISHFKFGHSVTGSLYLRLQFGPVPNKYDYKYNGNSSIEITEKEGALIISTDKQFKSRNLSTEELKVAKAIFDKYIDYSSKDISEISHTEDAWIHVENKDFIPFSYSSKLKHLV